MSELNRRLILLVLITILVLSSSGCGSDSNLAEDSPDFQVLLSESFAGTINHYQVALSPAAADLLGSVLVETVTLETVTATLTKISKNPLPVEGKLLALIIVADVLLFKYTLEKNMGPSGVIIDVWGPPFVPNESLEFQSPALCFSKFVDSDTNLDYCITLTDKGIQQEITIVLPDNYKLELGNAIKNLDVTLTIINTIPVYWKIAPRDG